MPLDGDSCIQSLHNFTNEHKDVDAADVIDFLITEALQEAHPTGVQKSFSFSVQNIDPH